MDRDTALMIVSRDWELPQINPAVGIDDRWLHAFLALRIADLLAQVAIGDRLHQLPPQDRAWFKAQGEQVVTDAVARYDVLLTETGCRHCGIRLACGADECADCWRRHASAAKVGS